MKIKDNKLEIIFLATAIVSHLVFIGFVFADDKFYSMDPLDFLFKFIMFFPIIGEISALILIISKNTFIIIPVVFHLIAMYLLFGIKYSKRESLIEKIDLTDKIIQNLNNYMLPFFMLIFMFIIIGLYYTIDTYLVIIRYIFGALFLATIPASFAITFYIDNRLKHFINSYLVKKHLILKDDQILVAKTYKNILDSTCSVCNCKINEDSVFGNSLIIEKNNIVIKCVKCRTGMELTFKKHRKRINRVDLFLRMEKYAGNYMLGLIHSLRILNFSLGKRPDESQWKSSFRYTYEHKNFDIDEGTNSIEIRYGIIAGNYCGECGYYFHPDSVLYNNVEFIQNGECPNCKLPNIYQWFLRSTFEAESAALVYQKKHKEPIVAETIEDKILRESELADAETQLFIAKLELAKDPENKALRMKVSCKQLLYDARKNLCDSKNKSCNIKDS